MFKNLKERLKSAKKTVVAVSVCALLFMGACGTAGGQNSDVNATLWSAPSTVKYMLDDSPVSDYGENMNVSLAANEKESAQLTVTPKTNVKNYEISISDLTGDNGHTISKENVSVFVEKYINVSTVTTVFRAGYYPDALVPYDSVKQAKEDRIKAGQNQTFLFTVYAPENTPAGNYSADVTIKLNGQTRTSKLNVTVYDFAIPTESHSRTSFFLWYDQFMYQCDNVTGELIDYYSDKNNIWSYIWLGVEGNSAEEFFFRYGFDEFNYVLPLTGVDELRAIIADMLSRPETNAPDLYMVAKTYEFLSCFASKISTFKRKSEAKYSDNLNKVVEYIHRNYYRDLSITEICEKFGFERSTLYRMFIREFGVSTQEYILIYRLEVAENCITHTSMSFKTIAIDCGFNNYAHFSGSFKRYKGVSPKEYREQTEKQKLLQINKNQ